MLFEVNSRLKKINVIKQLKQINEINASFVFLQPIEELTKISLNIQRQQIACQQPQYLSYRTIE